MNRPIVLIHGYSDKGASFRTWREKLASGDPAWEIDTACCRQAPEARPGSGRETHAEMARVAWRDALRSSQKKKPYVAAAEVNGVPRPTSKMSFQCHAARWDPAKFGGGYIKPKGRFYRGLFRYLSDGLRPKQIPGNARRSCFR
jgi:hypothetical protein